jgi:hypothetical protein
MKSDLLRRFAELRTEDARRAPSFGTTVGAARARRNTLTRRPLATSVRVAAAVVVAAAALTAGVLFGGGRNELATSLMSETRWEAPSDFLLHTPGAEFLASVPVIAVPEALAPLTTAEEWREP